nr:PG0870-related protein [Pontibacter harenae]
MNQYRYILQPYGNGRNTRFACPGCGKKRKFTRYVDTETGQYVHETVGSCNRQSKCGYHYSPRQFFTDYPWLRDGLQTAATWSQTKSNPSANGLQPENQTLRNGGQPSSNPLATHRRSLFPMFPSKS